jgi:hypothetical protein
MLTILLVLAWTAVAVIGRSRSEDPSGERSPLVTVVLVSCLLCGAVSTVAVPVVGLMSVVKDSVAGKLTSGVAVLIGLITVVVSVWYVFPQGFGK